MSISMGRVKFICPKCKKLIKRIILLDKIGEEWICKEHGRLNKAQKIL